MFYVPFENPKKISSKVNKALHSPPISFPGGARDQTQNFVHAQ